MMKPWPGHGEHKNLLEWQKADRFSTLLKTTCASLKVPREREWLIEILSEASDNMPRLIEEGQQSPHLAEYILALDAVHSYLVVIEYCLNFMLDIGLIEPDVAMNIDGHRDEFEELLASRTQMLRRTYRSEYRFSSN